MDTKTQYITILWALLEAKLSYYSPELIHPTWKTEMTISDAQYDALEAKAKELAIELGEVFVPVVGVPDTASMKAVRFKFSHKKRSENPSCLSKVV